jgi:hypothetical protein
MIFAGRDIAYIDALVFAAGSCTGAGLNPVDINKLNTWQQVRTVTSQNIPDNNVVLHLFLFDDLSYYFDQYGRCGCSVILVS